MGELVAFMGGVVVLVSFVKLCLKGYRYLMKRYEIDWSIRKRRDP